MFLHWPFRKNRSLRLRNNLLRRNRNFKIIRTIIERKLREVETWIMKHKISNRITTKNLQQQQFKLKLHRININYHIQLTLRWTLLLDRRRTWVLLGENATELVPLPNLVVPFLNRNNRLATFRRLTFHLQKWQRMKTDSHIKSSIITYQEPYNNV